MVMRLSMLATLVAVLAIPTVARAQDGEATAPAAIAGPCSSANGTRYVDCGNGTVTDTVTGLIWLKDAGCVGSTEFAGASEAAASVKSGDCGGNLADGSSPGDWRLPTREEWAAVIRVGCDPSLSDDAGTGCFDPAASSFAAVASAGYWSSSPIPGDPSLASIAVLDIGDVMSYVDGLNLRVWPVRGGQR